MSTMSATRLHDPNQPFRKETISVPEPGPDDVLVRVRACGVVPNLANVIHFAERQTFTPVPDLPAVYGLDPAGEIAAVGANVLEVKPGQRVYINPGRSCGSCFWCRNDDMINCESYTFAGYFGFGEGSRRIFKRYHVGGFAEFMVAPASSLVVLPDEVTYEEAARLGYLGTAYAAMKRAGAEPGTTMLVNGATGTLGAGAVLLALAMGITKILAVARDERLLDELRAIAPGRIFTHSNNAGSCVEWARGLTDGRGPDVVMEALPPGAPLEATMDAMASIRRGGTVVTVGAMSNPLPIDPIWIMLHQITYTGSLWFTTAQGHDMVRMAAAGTLDLKRLVHKRFSLDQVTEALEEAKSREVGGLANVVVMP
ncbi:MAG TPA: alcohol dehydrogenase catalytic domain-containing protein [Novosphingobium sp.]|nr:alcohol dehydrogenase catalytic domain-containing protein [Novosphingobium sp.]